MVTNVAEKPRTAVTGAYTLSRRPDSLASPQVSPRDVSDLSQHTRPVHRNPARSWSQAGGQGSDTANTARTGVQGAGQGGPMQVDTGTLHGGGVWPFASQEDTPCPAPPLLRDRWIRNSSKSVGPPGSTLSSSPARLVKQTHGETEAAALDMTLLRQPEASTLSSWDGYPLCRTQEGHRCEVRPARSASAPAS